MQHIPHTNLEEKHVWPDITLSGEDIHSAYLAIWPERAKPWDALKDFEQWRYNDMAVALTSILKSKEVTITAVRCPRCGEMFTNFKLREHPCL